MVVAAFPVAKLGALLVKQISKPIANALKQQAKSSPVFRKYVCMPPAQFYNWCEVQLKMWILNLGKPVNIPVLSEAMAIELGANLLGEGVIFVIAAGILVAEYNRSARKDAAKEQAKQEEMDSINRTIKELFFQAEQHSAQIRELMRMISDLETRVVQKPWVPKKDPTKDISDPQPRDPPSGPPSTPSLQLSPNFNTLTPSKLSNEIISRIENQPSNSLLLRSVNSIETELWSSEDKQREPGILTLALNHIYKEVYRVPLSL